MKDEEIEVLLNNINNLSKEEQIEKLKTFKKSIIDNYEELESNFIVGTFISGCSLGLMSFSDSITDAYISLATLGIGVVIILSSSKNIYKTKNIRKNKL